MEHTLAEIDVKCKEADMVLVGIGEEFQYDWEDPMQNERWKEIAKELEKKEEKRWIIPFLQKMVLERETNEQLDKAYRMLLKMLEGRNYFILSAAMDDYIYRYEFARERIVTPCGGFRQMQCDDNCSRELYDVDEKIYSEVKAYFDKKLEMDHLQEPICKKCGEKIKFNQLGVKKYAQEGYLSQWERYTKWLQGTLNKKLCVIELGAGMQIPSLIRWPFEKIVYYNRKSFLYRIHSSLYQLGEEIGDRGTGVQENSINFLAKGFVNCDLM
ncbi:MAG: hypothetical protein NC434_05075 [Ruminococcus sp.]|nr:hypothetical protein [Ruminococcus sp.]